jgi:hypothetical protein
MAVLMAERPIDLRTVRRTAEQIEADARAASYGGGTNRETELEAVEMDLLALADRWVEIRQNNDQPALLDSLMEVLAPIYGHRHSEDA